MHDMGEKLRIIRIEKNLSLREAAERMGVSHTYLNALEKGVNPQTGRPVNPSAKTLRRVSETYNIPMEELLLTDRQDSADEESEIEHIAEDILSLSPKDREIVLCLVKRLKSR